MLIGTCNRFEVYLETSNYHWAIEETIRVVSAVSGLAQDYVSKVLRVSFGTAVAQHLYSVASGLESMVIGESEIAGQVRRSLAEAQQFGDTTPALNQLFQTASMVSKRVASQTGLGSAGRSIVATGLELFEHRFGALAGKRILVVGTGAYARVTVGALQRLGVAEILVYSESGRAEEFSANRETTPVEAGGLRTALATTALTVTASGSRNYSVSLHLAQDVLNLQAQLGLPVGLNVLDAVAAFEAEQAARTVDPVIAGLRGHIAGWVTEEVERVRRKLGDETADEVARSLNRVANALLHTPTINAKESARTGNQADYIEAVKTLFGIDLSQLEPSEIESV